MITPQESRARRHARRWPLQKLVNASGVNKAYICEWENGERVLKPEQLRAIEAALAGPCDCTCCDHGAKASPVYDMPRNAGHRRKGKR